MVKFGLQSSTGGFGGCVGGVAAVGGGLSGFPTGGRGAGLGVGGACVVSEGGGARPPPVV
jgi:hypothetical protein